MKKETKIKQKSKIIFIIILILLIIAILTQNVKANEIQYEEYSYDYKKWLELPEEERAKTIPPEMFTVPLEREAIYNKSMYEMILRGESIPSSYTIDTEVPISNQGKLNICWAYASNLVLQTSVQKMLRLNETQRNYSEKHLDYSLSAVLSPTGIEDGREILNSNGLYRNTNTSGSFRRTLAYWVSGRGPILENLMPYNDTDAMNSVNELEKGSIDVQVDGSVQFATIFKKHNSDGTITYGSGSDFTTTYTDEQVKNNRNNIKIHIINKGAVSSSICMVNNNADYLSSVNAYINKDQYTTNHVVTIIGWDDNYSVSNFPTANRPTNPGAWIVANSWGTNWGNQGLFYISYEDVLVEAYMDAITQVSEVDYDNIYQHDMFDLRGSYSWDTKTAYEANVFQKKSEGIEEVNAVTIYTKNNYANYEIYVNQYNDDKNINLMTKVGTIVNEGTTGYQTLKLAEPIKIYGNKWVVMVKITTNRDEKIIIPVEKYYHEDQKTIVVNPGESFAGYNYGSSMIDTGEKHQANIGIKARTVELISNKSISIDSPAKKLKEGQTITISIEMTSAVTGTAPTLNLKFGNGSAKNATFVSQNQATLVYNYTIQSTDNGEMSIEGLEGGTLVGTNSKKVAYAPIILYENNQIIADNIPPTPTVTYNVTNIEKKTNKPIIATITFNEENVTMLNNSGSNTYTFNKSESFTFEFQDEVGNKDTKTITINSIDTDLPVITIQNNGSTTPAKQHSTQVTVTDKSSQIVKLQYIWLKEGEELTSSNWNNFTTGETLTKSDGDGNWKLHIKAEDEAGNIATISSKNYILDNTPPTATIEYTEQETIIIATIKFQEPNVTIINNEGRPSYIFKRNGSFTFKFKDQLENIGEKTVTIDKLTAFIEEDIQNAYDIITGTDRKYVKIDKFKETQYQGKYTLTMKQMVQEIAKQVKNETTDNGSTSSTNTSIAINSPSSKIYTYTSTNQIAGEDDTAKTGMKLKVGNNEYIMVCIGDISGDGQIKTTDVSQMKLHFIGLQKLSEEAMYAADVNNDGDVSLTDFSQLKVKIEGM